MLEGAKRTARVVAVISAAWVLAGCSQSITTVKNSAAPKASFTIGQVLDHKDNCSSSSWSASKDANDHPVVEFKCALHTSDATISQRSTFKDAREAAQRRVEGGVDKATLPGVADKSGQTTLSILRTDLKALDEDSDQSKEIADDPTAAAQFADLRQRWKTAEADLDAVDSECRKQLPQLVDEREAAAAKFYREHRDFAEAIAFMLKDKVIVERQLSISDAEGHDLTGKIPPSLLYEMMLDPDPNKDEERVVLAEAAPLPADTIDYAFCGHPERYLPVAERMADIKLGIDPAWSAFKNRQREGVHPLPSSR
jgi:hypothetical protein